jgi:hypothetical protein
METLFIYLLKSNGLITLFFLAYYFLLRKETFFTSNRWFLLVGLITSAILPLLVFTKTVWVEPSPTTIDWSQIPVGILIEKTSFEMDWFLTAGIVYALGIIAFMIRFGLDYYSLTKVFKGKTIYQQADFKFIDVKEKLAPFSFFNTIVYNSALYSVSELQNIIEHEKVHSEQNHSIDVLITRVFSILFWFNPVIWLYQKAILQNLEFIADSEALLKISDKKAYQITLLKITAHENCVALSNHFYQSLIKKRIIMLNKNQSNKRNLWKYAIVVPALVAFFMLFQVNVVAQEKAKETALNNFEMKFGMKVELLITSNSTEKELNAEKDFFKEEYNLEMNFSEITTNKNNELIAIKVELKDKDGIRKVNQIEGKSPIKPFTVFAEKDSKNKLNFGFSADINKASKRHFDLVNGIKGAKKENIAVIEDNNFWSINNAKKNGSNCLIIVNGTKQTENNIIKIPLEEEILAQVTLEPAAAMRKYGSEGRNGAMLITTGKSNTISKTTESKSIFNSNIQATDLGLENVDPNNLSILQKPKNTKTFTKKTIEINGIPSDAEYFIDGKKVSQLEGESMNPNDISSVNVQKDGTSTKNAIRIITKSYLDNKEMIPEPPTVSAAPTFKSRALKEDPIKKEDKGWVINFGTYAPEDNIKKIQNNKNVDYKKAVIIINGEISDYQALEKLKPEEIDNMSVEKISTNLENRKIAAIKKYGEKALNGIIEVETKEFQKK